MLDLNINKCLQYTALPSFLCLSIATVLQWHTVCHAPWLSSLALRLFQSTLPECNDNSKWPLALQEPMCVSYWNILHFFLVLACWQVNH
jgi:hypothetical protein